MKKIVILNLLFACFISCEKVVDANELLETNKEVFISSFISPQDTVLRVFVGKILPSIGTTFNTSDEYIISDAEVSIADSEGNLVNLKYATDTNSYVSEKSSITIEAEKSYFLQVVVNGDEFNSTCTIPKQITDLEASVEKGRSEYDNVIVDVLKLTFTDFKDEKNFYKLGAVIDGTYLGEENEFDYDFSYPIYFDTSALITDVLQDGNKLSSSSAEVYFGRENYKEEIILKIANMEETLYHYFKATENNLDAEYNYPFAEYSVVPNNMVGDKAFGIFAGYNLTETRIDVPEE